MKSLLRAPIRLIRWFGSRLEVMAAERPVWLAFIVFLVATALVVPISFPFYRRFPDDFLVNILSEAHGMVFDLLIIGWFLFWLNKLAERRLRTNRYREEIEDFLGWRSPEATHRIAGNIRRLNRSGVKEGIRLTEAYLKGANLAGASLQRSDLWGANLVGANLGGASLRRVNLAGANLAGADMERVDLTGADLRGATLNDADLERGDLAGADLRGATLRGADLQYAAMKNVNLERANLEGANLRSGNLGGANLRRTNLAAANLSGATLEGANLTECVFDGADLCGVSFLGAVLPAESIPEMFRNAKSLSQARFDSAVESRLREAFPHLFPEAAPPLEQQGSASPGGDGLPALPASLQSVK